MPPAAAGKVDYYFDTHKSAPLGFGIWVTANGAKAFHIYRKVNGRPERIRIGRFPDLALDQARKKAAALNGAIADGENPADRRRAARSQQTLAELLEDFLAHRQNKRGAYLSERTKANYSADFKRYMGGHASRKVSALRREDIASLHRKIGKTAPYAANRILALLSSMYSFAREQGQRALENPCKDIRKFPEEHRDRFMHGDELRRFFEALRFEPNTDMRDFFVLCLFTGARRSNVAAMRWGDLNFDTRTWRIPTTKNGDSLTVPLTTPASSIIDARKTRMEESDKHREVRPEEKLYVFRGPGKAGHLMEPKVAWQRVLMRMELVGLLDAIAAKAGLTSHQREDLLLAKHRPLADILSEARRDAMLHGIDAQGFHVHNLRIHDLRHTAGSYLAATGANIATSMQALGHRTAAASLIYAKMAHDPVRDAMTRAAEAILHQAGVGERPSTPAAKQQQD